MKLLAIGVALLSIGAFGAPDVSAQPYCAFYADGTRDCGIPTLQVCTQSVAGVGGYCGPDETQQIPPNFLQRLRERNPNEQQILHPPDPSQNQPGGLNWMPPPPQQ
jgi:hypothetical protein